MIETLGAISPFRSPAVQTLPYPHVLTPLQKREVRLLQKFTRILAFPHVCPYQFCYRPCRWRLLSPWRRPVLIRASRPSFRSPNMHTCGSQICTLLVATAGEHRSTSACRGIEHEHTCLAACARCLLSCAPDLCPSPRRGSPSHYPAQGKC